MVIESAKENDGDYRNRAWYGNARLGLLQIGSARYSSTRLDSARYTIYIIYNIITKISLYIYNIIIFVNSSSLRVPLNAVSDDVTVMRRQIVETRY